MLARRVRRALVVIIDDLAAAKAAAEATQSGMAAEQIAKLSYEKLSAQMDEKDVWVSRVTIWENDRCSAAYYDELKDRAMELKRGS